VSTPQKADSGRHRRSCLVLPDAPDDAERDSFAGRSLPYLSSALITSAVCIIVAQVLFEARHMTTLGGLLIVAPFAASTLLYAIYQATSLPVNFSGRSFDYAAHRQRVASWRPGRFPSVDILLPICGEPTAVLRNTWAGVFELLHAYEGAGRAYILDDGDSDAARDLAPSFGFTYVRRPVHDHKKAGNLNHAFRLSAGEHIVIFDADFRPRPDFLAETLPYLDDDSIGIVQTPQYFRSTSGQTWIEQAAGVTLEVFYRAVQVSRDRFGSALCVGSNAVYRRAALAPNGGFTVIPYAEDSHTGLDVRYQGYALKYLPIPLAAGVCPSTLDAFMRQQYRWCCGATSLMWTKHMWRVPMPWTSRVPYIAGWLWNLVTAVRTLIVPLIPVTMLAVFPAEIRLRNALLLIPPLLTGTVLYPLWHNSRYSARTLPLAVAVGWAQVLSLWDYSRGKVMSWQASRSPGDATRRFRVGVAGWNGGLGVAWLALALWRTVQAHSGRFAIVLALGVVNAIVVGQLVFAARGSAAVEAAREEPPAGRGRGGRPARRVRAR
jgi:cellulose synthase/poly-beta-1,6-N-acetylglucosamine synthase-like glycosyltransferase